MFVLQRARIQNMQFAVDISDTPVILKQTKGHQIYNDNVDHVGLAMQSYNHAKFERSCCDGVRKKSSSFFFQQGNMSITPLEHVPK